MILSKIKKTKFISSFKFDKKKYAKAVLLDICYYIVIGVIIKLLVDKLMPNIMVMMGTKELAGKLNTMSLPEMQAAVEPIKAAYYSVIFYVIIIFILSFFGYNFFKGTIWNVLLNKKWSWKKFAKFCALNIILFVIFMLSVAFLSLFVEPSLHTLFLLLLFALSIYILNILHPLFIREEKIWSSIKQTIKIAVTRIHKFILPYIIIAIMSIILLYLLLFALYLPWMVYAPIYLIVLTMFFTWAKVYVESVVKECL